MTYVHKNIPYFGFTLIEIIIYMGIFSIVITSLIAYAWNVIEGGVKGTTEREIFTQAQYISNWLTEEIRGASGINSVSTTQLSLATFNAATNPTVITLDNGTLVVQQGSASPYTLNSQNTTLQNFTFTNYSSADNKTKDIQFDFTLAANYQGAGARQEYNGAVSMEGSAELRSN